jgi:hypothetical protein
MLKEAQPIGVILIVTLASEINCSALQQEHFQKYASNISERIDKVKLIPTIETKRYY